MVVDGDEDDEEDAAAAHEGAAAREEAVQAFVQLDQDKKEEVIEALQKEGWQFLAWQ